MALHIIILAAGRGERMRSNTPKVLHKLGGKPMLRRIVETAATLNPDKIHVIVGKNGDQLQSALAHSTDKINWVLQEEQLGTGHAVLQALPHIPTDSHVLILSADVPLIQTETLQALIDESLSTTHALGLLVASLPDPTGLGRIVRDEKYCIYQIVEEKDATPTQRAIQEIYSGICCAYACDLARWLPHLSMENAQKEQYLTEIIAKAAAEKMRITSVETSTTWEIQGVNNRYQLQQLERIWQTTLAMRLMLQGVTIADAGRIDIRGELICETDVFIDINTIFEGHVTIDAGCIIGPNCFLKNVTLGPNCHIAANSILEDCHLDADCEIGPFARLRPGTRLSAKCKIGNFVETKNVVMDEGSKASHLSYLGDAIIGQQVNIGAGTITCNYDGANKHKTIIEDNVFIGSDTQLVAPVTIGKNATVGAGSTIRKDVPPGELTFTEKTQQTIYGWRRKHKGES